MLKKIGVRDAKVGMFIHEVCGSWLDHPFWNRSFKLSTPKTLMTLKECGVQDVWIDTDKGLDVESDARVVTSEEENKKVDNVLQAASLNLPKQSRSATLQEESARAKKIHAKARSVVISMFQEMRLGRELHVNEIVSLVDEITQSVTGNASALICLARLKCKDDYIYMHSVAVCALMIAMGRQLGMEGNALRNLGVAGLLHDAGNILLPDKLLNKPRSMTDREFNLMKTHPKLGWKLLKALQGMEEVVLDVCLHHHERLDGAGYPERLAGDALSLPARMCAVCDVYDTITYDDHYKRGLPPALSIRKMAAWQEGHFDRVVFHAFVKTVGIYPAGTLVKLRSERLAVVTDQADKSLLTPVVKTFFSVKNNARIIPQILDLSKVQDTIVSVENPSKWRFDLKTVASVL
ncbi:MAG: HD-GYP domain-containing protein [Nitrosomonadales bacterium]|nr:HD-GYP domain-containing protein [Nitrosomonadales bacterium]